MKYSTLTFHIAFTNQRINNIMFTILNCSRQGSGRGALLPQTLVSPKLSNQLLIQRPVRHFARVGVISGQARLELIRNSII